MTILAILILPEIILQVVSFLLWYNDQHDLSPRVLCVADYKADYPDELKRLVKESKIPWKISVEMAKGLTLEQAAKIIYSYTTKRNTAVIYLSIGSSDFENAVNHPKTTVIWDDSFQWKWRSRRLTGLIRRPESALKSIFSSSPFRTVPASSSEMISTTQLGRPSPKQKLERFSQRQKSSVFVPQSLPARAPDPKAFEDLPVEHLIKLPVSAPKSPFPAGFWVSSITPMDFLENGKMSFTDELVEWKIVGSELQFLFRGKTIRFYWQKQGESLVLQSEHFPISMVLHKSEKASPVANFSIFLNNARAWRMFISGDLQAAEDSYKVFLNRNSENFPARAVLARVYWRTGAPAEARKQVDFLQKAYAERPNQEIAESLFFSMEGMPFRGISKTAESLFNTFPTSVRLWIDLASYARVCGNAGLAKVATERASQLIPAGSRTGLWFAGSIRSLKQLQTQLQTQTQIQANSETPAGTQALPQWKNQGQTFGIYQTRMVLEKQLGEMLNDYAAKKVSLVLVPYPYGSPGNVMMFETKTLGGIYKLTRDYVALLGREVSSPPMPGVTPGTRINDLIKTDLKKRMAQKDSSNAE